LSGIRKSSLLSPTPEQFVVSAIDRIALPFTTGYWSHEIQVMPFIFDTRLETFVFFSLQDFVQSLLPEFLSNKLTIFVLGGIRAKALKKKGNKAQ
jgi:hypothetical protein